MGFESVRYTISRERGFPAGRIFVYVRSPPGQLTCRIYPDAVVRCSDDPDHVTLRRYLTAADTGTLWNLTSAFGHFYPPRLLTLIFLVLIEVLPPVLV